ncbi:hypothetical protein VTN49DRAFT_1206 [Thermomyces lanuginosus]|uniref:uncharacterized protein n=1 Tax=Thermomyces lanuginosus TaxID=5541 RepID=UPI00374239DC
MAEFSPNVMKLSPTSGHTNSRSASTELPLALGPGSASSRAQETRGESGYEFNSLARKWPFQSTTQNPELMTETKWRISTFSAIIRQPPEPTIVEN